MELYSRNPPNMAPSKLEKKATPTSEALRSSAEKTNPEKKIGRVRMIGISTLLRDGDTVFQSKKDAFNPIKIAKQSNPYMSFDAPPRPRIVRRFAKNAMIKISAMTMLITIQVLPYKRANSVMALVSISMNPLPSKKHGIENPALAAGTY